ncbi:unnamed protein product [Adineta ricciae]|uniref:Uncharacterized protein n=1 Tax=Adineta ricciae TaxID=249248 RepID=A0A815R0K9_ADIRI|nr:unnamed protein product [Adineta ricciae]
MPVSDPASSASRPYPERNHPSKMRTTANDRRTNPETAPAMIALERTPRTVEDPTNGTKENLKSHGLSFDNVRNTATDREAWKRLVNNIRDPLALTAAYWFRGQLLQDRIRKSYSVIMWRLLDGELQGRSEDSHYVYDYIPKEGRDSSKTMRFIFKERIDPRVDTDETIKKKFCHADNICLPLSESEVDDLPSDWTFLVKVLNFDPKSARDSIGFSGRENLDHLGVFMHAFRMEIIGSGPNDEEIYIDLSTGQVQTMINLDLVVKNLQ